MTPRGSGPRSTAVRRARRKRMSRPRPRPDSVRRRPSHSSAVADVRGPVRLRAAHLLVAPLRRRERGPVLRRGGTAHPRLIGRRVGGWALGAGVGGLRWRRDLPAGPQLGQGEVGGQPATAVVDRLAGRVERVRRGHRVAGDLARVALAVTPVSYTHLTLPTIYSV